HADGQYRPGLARRARPGPADGCRRAHLLRSGGLLRLRRLYDGSADDLLRLFALADLAAVADGRRFGSLSAWPDHGAPVRALSAAWHNRLGHRALLSVRPA